jgi:hypothetical protein
MSRVVIRSLRKKLEHVRHQHVPELTQKQDEQVQPVGNEPVNAQNTNATQRGEVNHIKM